MTPEGTGWSIGYLRGPGGGDLLVRDLESDPSVDFGPALQVGSAEGAHQVLDVRNQSRDLVVG